MSESSSSSSDSESVDPWVRHSYFFSSSSSPSCSSKEKYSLPSLPESSRSDPFSTIRSEEIRSSVSRGVINLLVEELL